MFAMEPHNVYVENGGAFVQLARDVAEMKLYLLFLNIATCKRAITRAKF